MNDDTILKMYKKLQNKTLSVYIETDKSKKYHVTDKDQHISLYSCNSREKAVNFCRLLDINIIAFVTHKL